MVRRVSPDRKQWHHPAFAELVLGSRPTCAVTVAGCGSCHVLVDRFELKTGEQLAFRNWEESSSAPKVLAGLTSEANAADNWLARVS